MVYHVGTVGAKHWLYSRLSTDADKTPDTRSTHFSDQLPPEYFPGLVSETYDPAKNRFINRRGARNEPLDTWVYAYAAAHHPELRLHRYTKADWDKLEARLQAPAQAAAALPADSPAEVITPPRPATPHPSATPMAHRLNRRPASGRPSW
jgi:phage terminase large subunit GpA-like protein